MIIFLVWCLFRISNIRHIRMNNDFPATEKITFIICQKHLNLNTDKSIKLKEILFCNILVIFCPYLARQSKLGLCTCDTWHIHFCQAIVSSTDSPDSQKFTSLNKSHGILQDLLDISSLLRNLWTCWLAEFNPPWNLSKVLIKSLSGVTMEINSNLLQIQSNEERLLLDVSVCVLHSHVHIVHALHNA